MNSYTDSNNKRGEFEIRLTGVLRNDIDWESASRTLRPLRGCVAVEMDHRPETMAGIHLPDDYAGAYRPDRGTVVAAHANTGLVPGTVVVVSAYGGQWTDGFVSDGFSTDGEVRFYGHLGLSWKADIWAICGEKMQPTGSRVLLDKDNVQKESHGLLLPDGSELSSNVATVRDVGPDCNFLTPGMRVLYSLEHIRNFRSDDHDRFGIIPSDHIWGIVE